MRIVVLSGSVVGVTTAYQPQRDGHEMVVAERNPEVAAGASWGNARMIAPRLLGRSKNPHPQCGHGHFGWTMSHRSARIAADLVARRTPAIPMRGLLAD
jgi:glycine/D-amino acid oxidase-like deaminating enzyme